MPKEPESRETKEIGIPGLEAAEFVGRGGAAIVYKAKQTSLQRIVAVKLLNSSWDESVARRFDREQRAMGRLSNKPGIVPVYESGITSNGAPYIMMPFYADGSLKDWSEKQGPIPWQKAAEIILDVAEAIGRAHDEGVIHRDLKPANILLSSSGKPLLADFGIARLVSDGTGVHTTSVAFTPAYCPPEVLDEAEPNSSADTYALAATFWALVQGRPPFTDSDTLLPMEAVLKRVLTEPPGPLDGVPSSVAAFIDRSMSKEPDHRPEDGQAFADELRDAIALSTSPEQSSIYEDETVVASKPAASQGPPPREKPRLFRAAMAFTMLLVLGVIAFTVLRPDTDEVAAVPELAADPDDSETAPRSDMVILQPGQQIQLLALGVDPLSSDSVQTRRAAELAIEDFGPIDDFTVELLPTLEVTCEAEIDESVRDALEKTETIVLVGSACSESVSSVVEAANQIGLSWISSDLRLPDLTAVIDGSAGSDHVDGFFRTAQNDHFQGVIAAQFALDELGAQSAVVVRGILPGHSEIADSFLSIFGHDSDVSVLEVSGATDVAIVAADLMEADPDVYFWILDPSLAAELATAIGQGAGTPTDRIAIDAVLSPAVVTTPAMVDVFVVTPLQPPETALAATGRTFGDLRSSYIREFGEPPENNLVFASAYDATVLALESIEATAVAKGDELELDRNALRTYLESARSEGFTGSLQCNFLGDCGSQAMAIVQIDGNSLSTTMDNVVKLFRPS